MRCWKFSGPLGRKGRGVVAQAAKRSGPLHFPSHRTKGRAVSVPKSCRLTCRGRSGVRLGLTPARGGGVGVPAQPCPWGAWGAGSSTAPAADGLLLDARAPAVLRRASRSLIRRSKHLKASRSYHCSRGRASDSIMNLLSGVIITMFYL